MALRIHADTQTMCKHIHMHVLFIIGLRYTIHLYKMQNLMMSKPSSRATLKNSRKFKGLKKVNTLLRWAMKCYSVASCALWRKGMKTCAKEIKEVKKRRIDPVVFFFLFDIFFFCTIVLFNLFNGCDFIAFDIAFVASVQFSVS